MSTNGLRTAPLTIAVIKPCCIGDSVMALPAIESLAAAFPHAHIHAFAGRHSAAVFRECEHVSRVYITPDQITAARAPGLTWNLHTAGHDWIVVLDRSRWINASADLARPARLVKLARTRSIHQHEVDVYLDALRAAGVPVRTRIPTLNLTEGTRNAVQDTLASLGSDFAAIQPGGGENPGASMPDKRWPADHFVQIVRALNERGVRTVLTGGPSDRELCAKIAIDSGVDSCVNLAGKHSLMETAAVIEQARLYLGADTGMSHLAAAVGTPSIVTFGPTNPLRFAPRGEHVTVLAPIASRHLADVDLRKLDDSARRPSTSEISVREVLAAIDKRLNDDGRDAP